MEKVSGIFYKENQVDFGIPKDEDFTRVKLTFSNGKEVPFGAKDSELQEASYHIPEGFHAEIDGDMVVIKKREKKSSWSEEDEKTLNTTISFLSEYAAKGYENAVMCIDWLKSLKERYTWKPSKEQIIALRFVLNNIPYNKHKEAISGLLDQIKEL